MVLTSCLLVAVFIVFIGKDASADEFSTKYCVAEGKECLGHDLGEKVFTPTLRQCFIRCSYNSICQGAFYDKVTKKCQMKTHRCTDAELAEKQTGTDLYRLVKGESCPADRPQYELPKIQYSKKFCAKQGKSCVGHDLYFKPQDIDTLEECLTKCSNLVTCTSVDYNAASKQCSPKDYHCSDDELTDDADMNNVMRIEIGGSECPADRTRTCIGPEECAGQNIECSDPNASPVGSSCQCNEGFTLYEDGTCVKPGITFCGKYKRLCLGPYLHKEPKIVLREEYCLDECIKVPACLSADAIFIREKKHIECYLKGFQCKESEMTVQTYASNFMRQVEGVITKCPERWPIACPSPPNQLGEYRKNYTNDTCDFECPRHSKPMGDDNCECDPGYEPYRDYCKNACPSGSLPTGPGFTCECQSNFIRNEEGDCVPKPREPRPNNCVAKEDGIYKFHGDCSKYIKCKNKVAYITNCVWGRVYDPERNECVYKSMYQCPY